MDILIQQVVSGLATGGIYASLALALVMIYQATDVVNFAQGEMAMFSTYLAWSMLQAGLPYWVAFAATVTIAFVGGLLLERIVIRPVEGAPILTIVIVTLGLLVIFNSVAGWIYSYIQKPFPSPFPSTPIRIGNVVFGAHDLGAIDRTDVAAVEAVGVSGKHKDVAGRQPEAAGPRRQRAPDRIQGSGMGHDPPVDGNERAVAADGVAGAGSDGLDQQRTLAQISPRLSEYPQRLREADDGESLREGRPGGEPVETDRHAGAGVPDEDRGAGLGQHERERADHEERQCAQAVPRDPCRLSDVASGAARTMRGDR